LDQNVKETIMSKRTKKTLAVVSAVTLLGLVGVGAFAVGSNKDGRGGPCGAEGYAAEAGQWGGHGHGHGRGGDRAAMMSERLANAKERLEITDDQNAAWNAFSGAVEGQIKSMQTMHQARRAARQDDETRPPSIDQRLDNLQAHADGMQQVAASARSLYEVLTAEQKATAEEMLAQRWGRRSQ